MKTFTASLFLILLTLSPHVNAGICRKIQGYVVSFDEKDIFFKILYKKKQLTLNQSLLSKEQLEFLKKNVYQLVEECVPYEAVVQTSDKTRK